MIENKKKLRWSKPKLIILARGNPEERILSRCKGDSGASGPGSGGDEICRNHGACDPECLCDPCSDVGGAS